jgi:hypothetical protein
MTYREKAKEAAAVALQMMGCAPDGFPSAIAEANQH